MKGVKELSFPVIGDFRGNLIALEGNKDIPFDVKRVYYIFDNKQDVVRGKHAHYNLKQVIFCPSGQCDFMLDNGEEKKTITLSSPDKAIYIEGNVWREFTNFSKGCSVVVLASEHYDESDYIRNYDDFIKAVK